MRQAVPWRRFMACSAAIALSLGASGSATAQPVGKTYRVGWLGNGNPPVGANRPTGEFQQGLRDVGYVEGRSLSIDYRYAGGNPERLAENAAELVRLPVDVIVTSGEPAPQAAMRATKSIPIVATEIGVDPVKAGFVASPGRPGGNVTGMTTLSDDLWQKRLALLNRQGAARCARHLLGQSDHAARQNDRGFRVEVPAADAGATERICGRGRAAVVLRQPAFAEAARVLLCRQDSKGRQAGRFARRAADAVRVGR